MAGSEKVPALDEVRSKAGVDAEGTMILLSLIKKRRKELATAVDRIHKDVKVRGIQSVDKNGFIYLIVNPKFSGWVKCGMTINLNTRLNSYNCYDPTGQFRFIATKKVENRRAAERSLLRKVSLTAAAVNGEWFRIDESDCIKIFNEI